MPSLRCLFQRLRVTVLDRSQSLRGVTAIFPNSPWESFISWSSAMIWLSNCRISLQRRCLEVKSSHIVRRRAITHEMRQIKSVCWSGMNHGLQKFRLDPSVDVILFSICSLICQKHTLIFTLIDDEVDEFLFQFYLLSAQYFIFCLLFVLKKVSHLYF